MNLFFLISTISGLALIILLAVPTSRKRLLIRPLLTRFRRVVPAMSDTEREALEAGSVWWDSEIFSGRPDWKRLRDMPEPTLTEEEQAFLDGPTEELCRLLDDWQITHQEQDLPVEVWAFIRQHRFFGLIIPKAYGGLDFSAYAHSEVVMKLASRSITAAVTIMVPNSLGPGKLLLHYGSEAQKRHWLPRLARADEIPCFALTGPKAGSDAGALPDTGVVCQAQYKGKQTLGIRLNWDKRYITLGPVATLLGLAFKLSDPQQLLGTQKELGITLALIPTSTPGIEIGERHIPLDIPFQNGPNRGRNVFIPLKWVIGERGGVGNGWRMLMECLSEGRGISLPALATGAGKTASRRTGAYARLRRQFGMSIGHFEGVEEALARIAGHSYQMDAARRFLLSALDAGERPSVVSAIAKYHLTERYRQVINDAMDIQGGSGICLGPNNWLGRIYQAVPISITVEGANILTRNLIIFGQGAIRGHPYLMREFEAAHQTDQQLAETQFDCGIRGHIGYLFGNIGRCLLLGLSRGHGSRPPVEGAERRYLQQLDWMSSAFALCADLTLMSMGGALKRRERLSARLGDVLSELYIASAAIKHFQHAPDQKAEFPLLSWALENSLFRMQEALRGLWRNLPFRGLSWLMRALVFPTGLPFRGPGDKLDRQAARILLSPSALRDRLTQGIFVSKDAAFPSGRLEQALIVNEQADAVRGIIKQARKLGRIQATGQDAALQEALAAHVISLKEAELLRKAERLTDAVIGVDAFPAYGNKNLRTVLRAHASADAA